MILSLLATTLGGGTHSPIFYYSKLVRKFSFKNSLQEFNVLFLPKYHQLYYFIVRFLAGMDPKFGGPNIFIIFGDYFKKRLHSFKY